MPELPEVQTIINTLNHSGVLHQTFNNVKIYKNKLIKNINPQGFARFLIGEKINTIDRIGKYLIFHLSNNKILTVHLRMEGKLFYEPLLSTYPSTHLRVEFFLTNNHVLRYYDSRMFGTFHIFKDKDYLQSTIIKKIALDPLNKEFNFKYLQKALMRSSQSIKTAILDQTNVSGIGNIYADEILFLSKIHPLTPSNKLTDTQIKNIVKYSKQVLLKAIKFGGTTVSSYKSDINHSGRFQNMLLVHTKKGCPCPVCGTKILKIKVNGRGTYFCPKCQTNGGN
jgi:formamidopyrimidine-DNA glycosylase